MSDKTCQCCKKDRQIKKRDPRVLTQFVLSSFKKSEPLLLCEHCDGEELLAAITKNKD